jgi:hypothetical protein
MGEPPTWILSNTTWKNNAAELQAATKADPLSVIPGEIHKRSLDGDCRRNRRRGRYRDHPRGLSHDHRHGHDRGGEVK